VATAAQALPLVGLAPPRRAGGLRRSACQLPAPLHLTLTTAWPPPRGLHGCAPGCALGVRGAQDGRRRAARCGVHVEGDAAAHQDVALREAQAQEGHCCQLRPELQGVLDFGGGGGNRGSRGGREGGRRMSKQASGFLLHAQVWGGHTAQHKPLHAPE